MIKLSCVNIGGGRKLFLSAERKRFYRDVTVYRQPLEEGGHFGILLDHRKLRTPLRKLFLVPSERLALSVAQEWNAQQNNVQPSLMHLTGLCNTVIDEPHKQCRVEQVESLVGYLASDTLWYAVSVCTRHSSIDIIVHAINSFRATEPDDLVAMQQKEWDPVIKWFNER